MRTPDKSFQDGTNVDVLVVDDESEAVEELIEFLARAKLKCRSAGDGWEALELLAEGVKPAVVVTDLRMPELDGMEFSVRLSQLTDRERPEVIFVSGHAGFDDAVAAIRLGARDMLTKPVDGPRLVRAVKSAQLARRMRQAATAAEATPPPPEKTPELDPIQRKRAALRELKAVRKDRAAHFPTELFSDPCWEMLLDLYDARLAGAEVTVTSLGAASGVPLTTALRRMEALQSHDLIRRMEDVADKRRMIVQLTEQGLRAVENFFDTYLARRGG